MFSLPLCERGEKERRWWTALDEEIFGVWPPAVANLLLPALVGSVDLFWIGRSGDAIKIAGMGRPKTSSLSIVFKKLFYSFLFISIYFFSIFYLLYFDLFLFLYLCLVLCP